MDKEYTNTTPELKEVKVSVPSTNLSLVEKLIKNVRQSVDGKDVELSFEFILSSLFPTCWFNIKNDLVAHYTEGYIHGYDAKEKEQILRAQADLDCYNE
jgi:hypothetical protein